MMSITEDVDANEKLRLELRDASETLLMYALSDVLDHDQDDAILRPIIEKCIVLKRMLEACAARD